MLDDAMGTFHVEVEIGDPEGRRYDHIDVLVDTGATYTSVSRPLLDALGVVPHTRALFVLADGRHVEREIGHAWLRVGDNTVITLVVFAEPGSPPLLGAYALEGLRLAADPVGRRWCRLPEGLLVVIECRPQRSLWKPGAGHRRRKATSSGATSSASRAVMIDHPRLVGGEKIAGPR